MWPLDISNFWVGEPVPKPTLPLLSTLIEFEPAPGSITKGETAFVESYTTKLSFVLSPETKCWTSFIKRICALPFTLFVYILM